MSHSHGRIECKECKKIIRSCRCMEAVKNIEYVVCDSCKEPTPPQGNKGEGMSIRERAEAMTFNYAEARLDASKVEDEIEQHLLQVAAQARADERESAIAKLEHLKKRYMNMTENRVADECIKSLSAPQTHPSEAKESKGEL